MMLGNKALLGGAVAALLLSAIASPSSANRLSLSTREWQATWREMGVTGGFGRTTCTLTLEGELHSRTFSKTRSALIGYIGGANTGGCGAFPATVLREALPWHLQYEAFSGTLPNITAVTLKIIGFEFKIRESFGIECLFRSTEARPLLDRLNREAAGGVRSTTLSGTLRSEACGLEFAFEGTTTSFTVPPPPPITLRLI
jgi:hypothetical protein